MARCVALVVAATSVATLAAGTEPIPDAVREFLAANCEACHTGDRAQAGIRLDVGTIDWAAYESGVKWNRVYNALEQEDMPPPGAPRPSAAERGPTVNWLYSQLMRGSHVGGAVPRRLNRPEYQNTIRDLFGMPGFEVPDAFPADDSMHGFDNVGEGLVLSPPLMAQFVALATDVANEILPPASGPAQARSKLYRLGTEGLAVEGGGPVSGGRFRLVSSRNMASAAAWPARFEAVQSGAYRIGIHAAAFQTDKMSYDRRSSAFRLSVYARPKTAQVYAPFGEIRKLAEFDVHPGRSGPQVLTAEIELMRGEIFGLRWEDGPAYSDPPRREYSQTFLADRLTSDRLYYAAMLKFQGGPRGTTQSQVYEATRALMESGELDLNDPQLDRLPEIWGGGLANAPHNWIKAFVHEEMFRFGPALDITDLEIEGPLRVIEDDVFLQRRARTRRFLGERSPSWTDRDHAEAVLRPFLERAFRRPASEDQVRTYADVVGRHLAENPGARLDDGLHLAVRRALVSPRFLYRGLRPGPLDAFDLASRLSYFLTSSPPDERLARLARAGTLTEPDVLAQEVERLIASPRSANFVSSFTSQWLSTRLLRGIMPDPRLLQFGDPDRKAMIDETEMFFAEILRKNLPLETFIDPGFSYRSARLNKIYAGDLEGNRMRRVTFERGGPFGGVLGLASVMMATANGVDTHPVLRGVWVLENIFGDPTPEPPPDVPAIAPDTSGANSMRDQLAAHRDDAACARCHNRIDPLGLVLENFDPVGRWREHYPVYTKPSDGTEALKEEYYTTVGKGVLPGPVVDSVGILADGTRIEGATGLKRYVLDRIEMFSACLAEKLLVYATGRAPSFHDRRTVDRIATSAAQGGNGFRDLIVALVQSESFATR